MSARVLGFFAAFSFVFSGCVFNVEPPKPVDGNARWAVLKCTYSDRLDIPGTYDKTLENIFNGKEGAHFYFTDISYGKYVPNFEISNGWRAMSVSFASETTSPLSRAGRINACMRAWNVDARDYDGVVATLNVDIDAGYAGQVLMAPGAYNVSFLAHEMFHHLGLGHSWDTSDRKNADWSQPGEYFDFWDIQSAMAIYGFWNANDLIAGPNLALPFKLALGWVEENNDVAMIDTAWNNGARVGAAAEFDLRPYHLATGSDWLGACVDLGDSDGGFTRWCAEYRQKTGWDRGIPESGVLVHFFKNGSLDQRMTIARNPMTRAGERFSSLDKRIRFTLDSIDEERAHVSISY